MGNFTLPELTVGDRVFFFDNPTNPKNPQMGFVSRKPGVSTISILVFAGDTGFIEKPSVRHIDDPFWKDSESVGGWQKWGAFQVHPEVTALKEVQSLLTKTKVEVAKASAKKKKPVAVAS
tara:strand:+ start:2532 stop:2891 length:360 start_codon:yes stop_codon:yes gene_type:complete